MHASLSTAAIATIRLSVLSLLAGMLAGGFELLALQAPGSPLYIGMLPGPVGALRELCVVLGLLALAAGVLMPWAYAEPSAAPRARATTAVLGAGLLLALVAQAYGAAQGMHGVQVNDLRPDARAVFYARHTGLLLFGLGFLEVGLRVLRRPPST